MDIREKQFLDESITAGELIEFLKQFPKTFKVYVSRDSEGNGFATMNKDHCEWSRNDRAIILYPYAEGYEFEDIMPIEWAEMESENE